MFLTLLLDFRKSDVNLDEFEVKNVICSKSKVIKRSKPLKGALILKRQESKFHVAPLKPEWKEFRKEIKDFKTEKCFGLVGSICNISSVSYWW